MGHGFDSEDQNKPAGCVVGPCRNPWIALP